MGDRGVAGTGQGVSSDGRDCEWYVAHTYSGYENTVAATIEKAVENRNMHDLIQEINIPMETVTEVTDTVPRPLNARCFPAMCW